MKLICKTFVSFVFLLVFTFLLPSSASATCTKIKDSILLDASSNLIVLGFDQFGYNYNAHMFNGSYDGADRVLGNESAYDYADDKLVMKWSDEWLSNQDCYAPFGKLDRGGAANVSKGWLTNQIEGDYLTSDGESHHYTYFAKFIWVGPAAVSDPWAATRIWGEYATIEEVYNDPDGGYHGVDRSRLANPAGLGYYTN